MWDTKDCRNISVVSKEVSSGGWVSIQFPANDAYDISVTTIYDRSISVSVILLLPPDVWNVIWPTQPVISMSGFSISTRVSAICEEGFVYYAPPNGTPARLAQGPIRQTPPTYSPNMKKNG